MEVNEEIIDGTTCPFKTINYHMLIPEFKLIVFSILSFHSIDANTSQINV